MKEPWPKTLWQLFRVIWTLTRRKHDYGTCVYAMSLASVATYNYVASRLGVTGFQASCADLDIISRTRGMKHGFRLINYADLLYPQYRDKIDAITFDALIAENGEALGKEARVLLAENRDAHPNVIAHWKRIAALAPKATS